MVDDDELPTSLFERVQMLENLLVASATGQSAEDRVYAALRRDLLQRPELADKLPSFVRTCRSLAVFWPFIKNKAGTYAERRAIICEAFQEVMDFLEGRNVHPGDQNMSDALLSFDAEGVHSVWSKALTRRNTDPEGAITVARTLLETVCKRILDECSIKYTDREDLPKLYSLAARALNLAPDQHTEEPIKVILGGAMSLVNGIGTLRNRFSDAHGRGGRLPVKPSPRHASLAVNTAGAVATFLVETHLSKRQAAS